MKGKATVINYMNKSELCDLSDELTEALGNIKN